MVGYICILKWLCSFQQGEHHDDANRVGGETTSLKLEQLIY